MPADSGYDIYRRRLWQRRIRPVIAKRGEPHGTGLGAFRYVVERTIAWLHGFRRLRRRDLPTRAEPRTTTGPSAQREGSNRASACRASLSRSIRGPMSMIPVLRGGLVVGVAVDFHGGRGSAPPGTRETSRISSASAACRTRSSSSRWRAAKRSSH
ncbi:hypothetical protein B5181_23035 [Streptomyces sp. 4F]|nr:hypothetical protein B5181_23035 [Streptomyces sp. 4F]